MDQLILDQTNTHCHLHLSRHWTNYKAEHCGFLTFQSFGRNQSHSQSRQLMPVDVTCCTCLNSSSFRKKRRNSKVAITQFIIDNNPVDEINNQLNAFSLSVDNTMGFITLSQYDESKFDEFNENLSLK
ncbi:hypothetical protein BpHYR1_028705 [Brachionus plicatilis]|uniref:Uncharacterized protein n=1 Tax=Brachionus plicatilis TaxID=10195 RepID=A0A3M7PMV8_BRAPC|nr:hypothetical protein BpHYR1_028705 [Brachionus plicatilis]